MQNEQNAAAKQSGSSNTNVNNKPYDEKKISIPSLPIASKASHFSRSQSVIQTPSTVSPIYAPSPSSPFPPNVRKSTPESSPRASPRASPRILEVKFKGYLYHLTNAHQYLNNNEYFAQLPPENEVSKSYAEALQQDVHTETSEMTSISAPALARRSTWHSNKVTPNASSIAAGTGPWLRRWCMLASGSIFIFKSPKDSKPIYSIECSEIHNIEKYSHFFLKYREFCFSIKTYAKSYIFSAESAKALDEWIAAIQEVMKEAALANVKRCFNNLFNACGSDELKFAELALQSMRMQVPKWSNLQTMNTDVRRMMQYMISKETKRNEAAKQNIKNKKEETIEETDFVVEEKVEPWEIDFVHLKLKKKIAEGYFGEVYKGELWGKTVAIKRLKFQSHAVSTKIVTKLKQEAAVMSSLRHPNCVLFMFVSSKWPNICLVTEFVDNGSLYDVLQNHVISDKVLLRMVRDICCGMAYLHHRDILHLDLKPLNLLVDGDFNVKVADFGLSKLMINEDEKKKNEATGYGTLLYMSNEMCFEGVYTKPGDVFAFGVTLFELLYLREHNDINFSIDDTLGYELIREPASNKKIGKAQCSPWWGKTFVDLINQCLANELQERPSFEKIMEMMDKNIDVSDDWFIFIQNANNIRKLAKDPKNHPMLVSSKVWETIQLILHKQYSLEASYLALLAIVDLAPHTRAKPTEDLLDVTAKIEKFVEKKKTFEMLQTVVLKYGKFKYFKKILLSPHIDNVAKHRVLTIVLRLCEANDQICTRFVVKDHIVQFIYEQYIKDKQVVLSRSSQLKPSEIFSETAGVLTCDLLKRLSSINSVGTPVSATSKQLNHIFEYVQIPPVVLQNAVLSTFIEDYGVDSLVFLATKPLSSQTQYAALQALVDISVKDPQLALLVETKGIEPSKMASRLLQPMSLLKPSNLSEEDNNVYPFMKLSFHRGKDVFTSMSPAVSPGGTQKPVRSHSFVLPSKPLANHKPFTQPPTKAGSHDALSADAPEIVKSTISTYKPSFDLPSVVPLHAQPSHELRTPIGDATPISAVHRKISEFGGLHDRIQDEQVVSKIWKILSQEKDLNSVSKIEIREKLEQELLSDLQVRKELINNQINRFVAQIDTPSEILDFLFAGSEWNSAQLEELKQIGITHIINVSAESPNYFPQHFVYMNLKIRKSDSAVDYSDHFDGVFALFDQIKQHNMKLQQHALEDPASASNSLPVVSSSTSSTPPISPRKPHKILIHSQLGNNRSAIFIIAYIMKTNEWTLQKAFKYVKDRRKITMLSRDLMYTLIEYEYKLRGISTIGVEKSNIVSKKGLLRRTMTAGELDISPSEFLRSPSPNFSEEVMQRYVNSGGQKSSPTTSASSVDNEQQAGMSSSAPSE